jgi:hypothetical protein
MFPLSSPTWTTSNPGKPNIFSSQSLSRAAKWFLELQALSKVACLLFLLQYALRTTTEALSLYGFALAVSSRYNHGGSG